MSVLKSLLSVMEALLREHEALLALAERKKEVLIRNDMEALNLLGQEEIGHVHRVERLEGERQGALRLLSVRPGVTPELLGPDRLPELAVDAEEAEKTRSLVAGLRAAVAELKHRNDLNKQLIQQSLQLIQTTIEVMTESPQVPTYGGSGETQNPYQTGRTSFFDSKA